MIYNHDAFNSNEYFPLPDFRKLSVFFSNSVKLTYKTLRNNNIPVNDGRVYVGQLYGMCDHVSFGAAQKGLKVCKYVAFGPVRETMPYLIRRMQENKG